MEVTFDQDGMCLMLGDCLIKLKELPDNSVDSIVTDPPYELGFMGKSWDNTGIANNVDMWKECLRVLKPGAHLLSFGGTRTYHRMACAIEDAGFEIRDMIEWVYGAGFPKSLNIGKAVDKLQGNKREMVGLNPNSVGRKDNKGKFQPVECRNSEEPRKSELTKGTSEWEGWGTALKPAHEPICLARKPLSEKSVADNVLKWKTGGINIDESRVEYCSEKDKKEGQSARPSLTKDTMFPIGGFDRSQRDNIQGRFPANLIHDNSPEVRECFPETKSPSTYKRNVSGFNQNAYGNGMGQKEGIDSLNYGDSGSASRFFKSIVYTAKASKSERNKGCEEMPLQHYLKDNKMGGEKDTMLTGSGNPRDCRKHNHHPTVKPIALMEYLIKMVTPKGGVVLDPFMGSGSTGIAAKQNNFKFIGIELDKDYFNIAKKRIDYIQKSLF